MDLRELRDNWDRLARSDAFWAVLTDPNKKDGGWNVEEFFETGRAEIDLIIPFIDGLGLAGRRTRAMDFGCGVGRLTQALGYHFDEVWGVDIAPAMLERARTLNESHPYGQRCRFVLNEGAHLRQFEDRSFDLVYSSITLQHMEPRYAKAYLKEFFRVLAPGGLLVFQLPSKAPGRDPGLPGRVYEFLYSRLAAPFRQRAKAVIEMYGMPQEEVVRFAESIGGEVLDVRPVEAADTEWRYFRYTARRRG